MITYRKTQYYGNLEKTKKIEFHAAIGFRAIIFY